MKQWLKYRYLSWRLARGNSIDRAYYAFCLADQYESRRS